MKMSHLNVQMSKYTAIYRCSDDITNLTIRVRLNGEDLDQWDERTFRWQEKVFSRWEKEFYRDERNCVTDLDKKYHIDVEKEQLERKLDIFSYTNDDGFVVELERNPIGYNELDAMCIMADLGEFINNSWIKEEMELCCIKYDKKLKILYMYPDFNQMSPYVIEIDGSTSRKFYYHIDHTSDTFPEAQIKENELICKINNSLKPEILNQLGANFVLPPKNKLQIHLFFEILWAKHFEYDSLYVQYFIDLPSDWSCDDSNKLRGITQTCRTKTEDMSAHFGHTVDIMLEYNIEAFGTPKSPYIYFEIISKDSWGRHRTEGLTYKNLPIAKPGNYRFDLQCFRLIPDSISGQLRRFFIGDCSNYNDITWVGLPKDYDGSFLNKYGTNTVGTGLIGVRVNVLQHCQAFIDDDGTKSVFEKLNSSSLVKSVEQVLQAFKRARKNMIAARKNL